MTAMEAYEDLLSVADNSDKEITDDVDKLKDNVQMRVELVIVSILSKENPSSTTPVMSYSRLEPLL